MKRSWTLSIGVWAMTMLFAVSLSAHIINPEKPSAAERAQAADAKLNSALDLLPVHFPDSQRDNIKRLIREQLQQGRRATEATLGRAKVYFPIFEHYLQVYNLPEELKCVPFVESRLRLQAQSPAGARGLWQFMDYTAKEYHLRIDETVDERLDPLRATEAAMRLLSDLYDEFDDWLLALAAYNCGPGNVRKAIRRANSRYYWKLEKYLPGQTRHYIPAFIAAMYVVQHYEQHGLQPKPYHYRFTHVRALPVPVASDLPVAVRLPQPTMRLLNPGCKQEVLPAFVCGNHPTLPGIDFLKAIAPPMADNCLIAELPEEATKPPYLQKTFFEHTIAFISYSWSHFWQTPRRM